MERGACCAFHHPRCARTSLDGGTISQLGFTRDAGGLTDDACVLTHGLGTEYREVREDGGELLLGVDSDCQSLVGSTPSVVVPGAGGQELISGMTGVEVSDQGRGWR